MLLYTILYNIWNHRLNGRITKVWVYRNILYTQKHYYFLNISLNLYSRIVESKFLIFLIILTYSGLRSLVLEYMRSFTSISSLLYSPQPSVRLYLSQLRTICRIFSKHLTILYLQDVYFLYQFSQIHQRQDRVQIWLF